MESIKSDAIRSQLERILSSPEFTSSKRFQQFLSYIVKSSLDGQSENIKQYSVAVEALGYSSDYNPQTNPTVRILAQRLRRSLERYYNTHGALDPIKIEIPKGRYVPVFSLNTSNNRDDLLIKNTSPSIAVFLFDCLSDSKELGYMASGLTEEIIIALTKFSGLKVVGPLFKNILREANLNSHKVIGEKYGVRFILSGTLRKHQKSLRVTAKLIDTENGSHLWGESLTCKLAQASILDCEVSIVNKISSIIADTFGIINKTLSAESNRNKISSLSSYEAALRFYHWIMVLSEESFTEALNAIKQAMDADPCNALNLALMSDITTSSYMTGYKDSSVLDYAEELANRAVALDPNCQHAFFALALSHAANFRKSLFITACNSALNLNPNNANLAGAIGMHLWMTGEYSRGNSLMSTAIELNPHHPGWYHIVPFCDHYLNGEYQLALESALKINTPGMYIDPLYRAAVLGQLGQAKRSQAALNQLLSLFPDFKSHGRELMKRLVFLDIHVEMLWDGLKRSGI